MHDGNSRESARQTVGSDGDDNMGVVVARTELIGLGATLVRPRDYERPWTVLADPEGNEFCALPA